MPRLAFRHPPLVPGPRCRSAGRFGRLRAFGLGRYRNPVQQLFQEWQGIMALIGRNEPPTTDAEMEAWVPMIWDLEDRLKVEPATCLEDLAMKVVALSSLGDYEMLIATVIECAGVVGAPVPERLLQSQEQAG